jgi:hypothetical protein
VSLYLTGGVNHRRPSGKHGMLHGDEAGGVAASGIEMVPVKRGNRGRGRRVGSGQRDRSDGRLWRAGNHSSREDEYSGELGRGQMTLECGIVQRAVPRAVEGRLPVQPDRKAGDALLVADAQVQNLEHTIKLHQIASGQMNRQLRRLIERVHAQRAGGA